MAAALLVAGVLLYRKRRITRLSLILTVLVGIVGLLLATVPDLFGPVFDLFDFRKGGGRRLTAVLLFSTLFLLILVFRTIARQDEDTRNLSLLIESLGVRSFDWDKASRLRAGDRIVVVIPAHNEAENVGAVVREIPKRVLGLPVSVVVVDDASDDGTAEVARAAGALVATNPIRRGQGMAHRVGYGIAVRLGATVVATLDADGQHVPAELPDVVRPVLEDEADIVQGSRMLGEFERESRFRHLGVLLLSRLVSLITRVRVTDVSSGYRGIRAEILDRFVLKQDQYSASEVIIEGIRHRARILEVPVTIRARAGGVTKKPKSFRYGWNFTKVIVQTWLR